MAYFPTLEDTPEIDNYTPTLEDTPNSTMESKDLSDHLVKQMAKKSPIMEKEDLFKPLIMNPTAALQVAGSETGKTPLGKLYFESLAAIPFGLEEGVGAIGSQLAAKNAPKIAQKLADTVGMIGKNSAFGAGLEGLDINSNESLKDRLERGALIGGTLGAG